MKEDMVGEGLDAVGVAAGGGAGGRRVMVGLG